jgi:transcription elongation factor Elf1
VGEKGLKKADKCDKLIAKKGWLMCPACGRGKVLKLTPRTRAEELTVYCKLCGAESIVNIDQCLSQSACAT